MSVVDALIWVVMFLSVFASLWGIQIMKENSDG